MNGYDYKPLVSINILSFNRREELRNTLTKVFEQDYKNIEVIVVDNASTDGSPEMVEKEFPNVKLIKLDKNIGIAGWNKGIEIASGEYVLVLDDDAYPGVNSLTLAIEECSAEKDVGCVLFNIIDLNSNNSVRTRWLPPKNIQKCEWPIFTGCSVLFNKREFNKVRMPDNYFLFHHELPVAADIILEEKKIIYLRDCYVFHYFKDQNNYSAYRDQYIFGNNLKFINDYFPTYLKIFYLSQNILFFLSRSIRRKWFTSYLSIIKDAKVNFSRKKLPLRYILWLRKYKIFNFPILSKFNFKKYEK